MAAGLARDCVPWCDGTHNPCRISEGRGLASPTQLPAGPPCLPARGHPGTIPTHMEPGVAGRRQLRWKAGSPRDPGWQQSRCLRKGSLNLLLWAWCMVCAGHTPLPGQTPLSTPLTWKVAKVPDGLTHVSLHVAGVGGQGHDTSLVTTTGATGLKRQAAAAGSSLPIQGFHVPVTGAGLHLQGPHASHCPQHPSLRGHSLRKDLFIPRRPIFLHK